METDLDKTVLRKLEERKGDWQAVASASGVSYSWLSKFANGHIPNPGYATLTRLCKALHSPELAKSTISAQQPATHAAGQGG
jgi:transcriptional regulator with XRE-family HTH domain